MIKHNNNNVTIKVRYLNLQPFNQEVLHEKHTYKSMKSLSNPSCKPSNDRKHHKHAKEDPPQV
jgi:hypothetical protein